MQNQESVFSIVARIYCRFRNCRCRPSPDTTLRRQSEGTRAGCLLGAALLDFAILSEYEGSFAGAKAPYGFRSLLTIFSVPRRLGLDEEAAEGTVSGTR